MYRRLEIERWTKWETVQFRSTPALQWAYGLCASNETCSRMLHYSQNAANNESPQSSGPSTATHIPDECTPPHKSKCFAYNVSPFQPTVLTLCLFAHCRQCRALIILTTAAVLYCSRARQPKHTTIRMREDANRVYRWTYASVGMRIHSHSASTPLHLDTATQ